MRGADGALIAYQWTGAALTDEHGQVSGLTGVGRDVTERKRADEILRQRETEMRQLQKIEAIGRLAGGVAHDFNNVLTVVIGRSQLMLSRYQPDDPAYQDLDQIESTAQRAASLTRQLLAFSRNQASARQPVDLTTTVTSVTDMLARLIGEHIDLAVTLDPKLDLVMADPGQIEQVIVNFAVNARDAMPNGGRLTIATGNVMLNAAFVAAHPAASVGPHVVLEVCDNRRRHGRSDLAAGLRAVLHDQGGRQGMRARAVDGVRDREGARRLHRRGERARARRDVPRLSPSHGGAGGARRAERADRAHARVATRRSCWSRTRRPSGVSCVRS